MDENKWYHFLASRHTVEMWKARCDKHLFIIKKWSDSHFIVKKYGASMKPLESGRADTLEAAKALCDGWKKLEKEEVEKLEQEGNNGNIA